MLEILAQSVDLYHVEVHAYVLMDNHFHLILLTPNANLNDSVHRFNTAYTVYENRRHERSGHLFQGRYKAILIDSDFSNRLNNAIRRFNHDTTRSLKSGGDL